MLVKLEGQVQLVVEQVMLVSELVELDDSGETGG